LEVEVVLVTHQEILVDMVEVEMVVMQVLLLLLEYQL